MATKDEIDAAATAIEKANEDTSGASYSDLLRTFAHVAIEATDRYRDKVRRDNCRHPNRRGSGAIGSDGASSWEWYCPDCGNGGKGSFPPNPEISTLGLIGRNS